MSFSGRVTLKPVEDATSDYVEMKELRDLASLVVQQLPDTEEWLLLTSSLLRLSKHGNPYWPQWNQFRSDRNRFIVQSNQPEVAKEFYELLSQAREIMESEAEQDSWNVALMRAAVLELIVYACVEKHYVDREDCEVCRGFQVYIDGQPTSKTDQLLDVGAWDDGVDRGELYEAKSACEAGDADKKETKWEYLERLAKMLDVKEKERIVAVVSWEAAGKVKQNIETWRWPSVKMYGRENIPAICAGLIHLP